MDDISFNCRLLTNSEELSKDWRDLEARADGGFFLSWDWIGCWLATIGNDVMLLEGRLDGRVVALGLLCTTKREGFGRPASNEVYLHQTGDPAADRIAIEYNGVLLDRMIERDGAMQALSALIADDGLGWDELFLRGLSQGFADAIVAGRFPARLRSRLPTANVDLAGLRCSGQAYLDQRSANTRSQIRHSIKRYEARGALQLEAASTVDRALGFFDALARISQTHLGGVSSGADEPGCGSICVALRQSGPGLIV